MKLATEELSMAIELAIDAFKDVNNRSCWNKRDFMVGFLMGIGFDKITSLNSVKKIVRKRC